MFGGLPWADLEASRLDELRLMARAAGGRGAGYRDIRYLPEVTGTGALGVEGRIPAPMGPSAPEQPLCTGNPGHQKTLGASDGVLEGYCRRIRSVKG